MKALLIIDIQNDFVAGGSLAVPGGAEIVPLINELQARFDLVVATQDWHPATHKSFASNNIGKQIFEHTNLQGLDQVMWPDHCVQGSYGAELVKELNPNKIEAIFRKGTDAEIDSYSGFYDNGHRKSTALAEYLRGKQIDEVYVVGLAADYCVYFTAKDAIKEGFTTYIVEDAVRAITVQSFDMAKADFSTMGGKIILSAAIQ